jgi:hypothetical protein
MQASVAQSADPRFQSFVNLLVSLGVNECAAIAIANKNDHPRPLMNLYSFVKGAAPEELGDLISQCLNLSQALDGEELEKTMEILEHYFLVTHDSMSSGKNNPAVQQFRLPMLEHAPEYCSNKETVALDDLVLQCGVTLHDLLDTKGTPAGVMGVFPEVLRDPIIGAIPKAPALLERVLAESEAARSARKRVREVLEEPDELFCDENISDRGRECKVDSADDKPASGEEASGDEASAEDESGFTTPKPRGMSTRDIELINRAPFKQPRGDQD